MEGCYGWIQLFREDRPGYQGERAALDVREQLGQYGAVCALGQVMSQLAAFGSGPEGSILWVTLWWVSATGHLIRKKKMTQKTGSGLMLIGPQGSEY
ncbi:hypothetical protein WISP_100112 [Willisornis vidua]|uniref:Uncharacterized protein n=1 Tax=Willisornis vidua TaxID=1566151 RepID=A0ABQ9D3R5_9PASS|nr:hypothetical protein WISP_100112 [Willisornis vidua]